MSNRETHKVNYSKATIEQLNRLLDSEESAKMYWYSRCMEAEQRLGELGEVPVEYDVSDEGCSD